MKNTIWLAIVMFLMSMTILLVGCDSSGVTSDGSGNEEEDAVTECSHVWINATCETPKTCSICSITEGVALGHKWVDASCEKPKTCSACSITEGVALGHKWVDASCDTPKTCSTCSKIEGVAQHKWVNATYEKPKTCSSCSKTEGVALGHKWANATCEKPKTCTACSKTDGNALGHKWVDASCKKPKTCSVCSKTNGGLGSHLFEAGKCTLCGEIDKNSDEYKYSVLKKKADAVASSCAQTVVRNMLKNPSTMNVLSEEILDSDEYFRYYVKIRYSAMNGLGGTVTNYAYVLIRVSPEMDGTFRYAYDRTLGINYILLDSDKADFGWGTEPEDWTLDGANKYNNPENVSIKMLLANPGVYEGKYIKITEKLVISTNYLSSKKFYTYQSTGDGKFDCNTDNSIEVFYRFCDNIDDLIMLDADYQKITVIGEVKKYSNSTEVYIEAYEIIVE